MKVKLPFRLFYIYYFGLIVLAVGMPLSIFLMSISYIIIAAAWLLTGNFSEKLLSFFHNRIALAVSSVFILHLLGLLYTADLHSGLNDVRIKIPLLLLPFLVSTMPKIDKEHLRWLLYIFCASVFIGTIIGCFILLGIGHKEVVDIRQISPFISHIRFSLMICFSIFILAYYSYTDRSIKRNIIYFTVITWFIIFMFILESLTGIIILISVSGILFSYYIFTRKNNLLKLGYVFCIAAGSFFIYHLIHEQAKDFYTLRDKADLHHLDPLTAHGHAYEHDLENNNLQNGYYNGIYVCWEEMEAAWNKRSKIKFLQFDQKGNQIRFTLQRYLTSKGLRKDEDGVNALTDEDVHCVEIGIPDARYTGMPTLEARIDATIWEFTEYSKDKDPSGHSVAQRLEFWKAAVGIIQKDPFIGVGTGDPDKAFKEEYAANGTKLKEKYRLRSHNQFLAIGVAFGIFGLILFLFSLIYPLTLKINRKDFLYVTFFLIALFSMINEDTLETQAGVTFFAFFNTLFLLGRERDSDALV